MHTPPRLWAVTVDLDALADGYVTASETHCVPWKRSHAVRLGQDDGKAEPDWDGIAARATRDLCDLRHRLPRPHRTVTSPTHGEVLKYLKPPVDGVINVDMHADTCDWIQGRGTREACWARIAGRRGFPVWHVMPKAARWNRRRVTVEAVTRAAEGTGIKVSCGRDVRWPTAVATLIGSGRVSVLHCCSSPGYVPMELLIRLVNSWEMAFGPTNLLVQTRRWLSRHRIRG